MQWRVFLLSRLVEEGCHEYKLLFSFVFFACLAVINEVLKKMPGGEPGENLSMHCSERGGFLPEGRQRPSGFHRIRNGGCGQ